MSRLEGLLKEYISKSNIILFLGISFYFLVYFPIVQNDALFFLDDETITGPIKRIQSLSKILLSSEVVDIQPFRDFSYWLDLKIKNIFDFYNFKYTNLLIWFLCFSQIKKFLSLYCRLFKVEASLFAITFIAVVLLLHPANLLAVGWISARKHLLAFLCIMLSTNSYLEYLTTGMKNHTKTVVFLLLSMLSHTIYFLWFIWMAYTTYQVKGNIFKIKNKVQYLSLVFISLGTGITNYIYYKFWAEKYSDYGGVHVPYDLYSIKLMMLSVGRYFMNLIDLRGNTFFYLPETMYNVIGCGVVISTLLILYRKIDKKIAKNLFVLTFISCATFVLFPLGTFVQNSYAFFLNTCLALTLLVAYSSSKMKNNHWGKIIKIGSLFFLCIELFSVKHYSDLWKENKKMVEYNHFLEPVPAIIAATVVTRLKEFINNNDLRSQSAIDSVLVEMIKLKKALEEEDINNSRMRQSSIFNAYYSFLLYLNYHERLTLNAKIKIVDGLCFEKIIYCNYFKSTLLAKIGKNEEADDLNYLSIKQLRSILFNSNQSIQTGSFALRWGDMLTSFFINNKIDSESKKVLNEIIHFVYQKNLVQIVRKFESNLAFLAKSKMNEREIKELPYKEILKIIQYKNLENDKNKNLHY